MPDPTSRNRLAEAKAVLDQNWRDGYTIPSARLYPFQWNWDSGFNALGLAYHRPERALEEIRNMFRGQWQNGMVPHINFHQPSPNYFPGPDVWQTGELKLSPPGLATSGITQPPVYGFILERMDGIVDLPPATWNAFLEEILPRVVQFHRYLYTHRDPRREGLVCLQHNWEAGTDNSPVWDAILDTIDLAATRPVAHLRRDLNASNASHRPTDENYRRYIYLVDLFVRCGYDDARIQETSPFLVQDVLFNSLLMRSNQSLIALYKRFGWDSSEIAAWNARTTRAMNAKLWDEATGMYYPYDLRNDRRLQIKTSSGLAPLFGGACDSGRAARLAEQLDSGFVPNQEWSLVPSTAASEPSFSSTKYWRGPVWVNMNWMFYHGLARHGFTSVAERVKADTLSLIEQTGLYEYFDARPPADGGRAGLGSDSFSWSAALYIDHALNPRIF